MRREQFVEYAMQECDIILAETDSLTALDPSRSSSDEDPITKDHDRMSKPKAGLLEECEARGMTLPETTLKGILNQLIRNDTAIRRGQEVLADQEHENDKKT